MKTTRTKQAKHEIKEIKETIENSKKTNQQGLKKVQLFMTYTLLISLVISISHPFLPKSITCLTSYYLISMISHGYSQFLHLLRPRWLAYVGIRKLLLTCPGLIIQVLCLQAALIQALICDIIVTPRSPSGHPFLFLLLLQLKDMPEMI